MSEIKISKVKLIKKEFLEISYSKTEDDNTSTEVSESHKTPVHPDLKKALQALAMHLACLTEYISVKEVKKTDLIENFYVSGYSKGGEELEEGVVITGQRTLKNGKVVIFNTPFTRFEESEESRYYFIKDLQEKIEAIETEVLEYLEGKKAPEPQMEMEFPEKN